MAEMTNNGREKNVLNNHLQETVLEKKSQAKTRQFEKGVKNVLNMFLFLNYS